MYNTVNIYTSNKNSWKLWNKIISIKLIYNISDEYCNKISKLIKEENEENWKHMIEKTPEEIHNQIINNSWVIAKNNDDIIWFISQEKVSDLNEIWSLIVDKRFRWCWLSEKLIRKIEENNRDTPSYLVSNSPYAIKNILAVSELKELERAIIEKSILSKIESVWKLLDNDKIFWNNNFIKLNNN